jgi:hypothetical protein
MRIRQSPRAARLGILMAALLSASSSAGPLDALRASNASVRRTVLDNGMVCLVKEDPSAPVVAVQIWVGSGAVHEQEFLGAGLSHYMEHMIFKGTPTRGPAEVTKAIDDAGARSTPTPPRTAPCSTRTCPAGTGGWASTCWRTP